MSIASDMAAVIARTLMQYGENVTFYAQGNRVPSATVRASVQQPIADPLSGTAAQEGLILYISSDDLLDVRAKDRFLVAGEMRTVEEVHQIPLSGYNLVWQIRVLG